MKLFKQQDQKIVYCAGSETLRLMPQNYCIAAYEHKREWKMFPDLALPLDVVLLVTSALMVHSLKWNIDPLKLVEVVNKESALNLIGDLSFMNHIEKLAVEVTK